MNKRYGLRALFMAVMALNAGSVQAGPYSDDLGKCLVASATGDDRNALVKWMFSMVALHPAVKSIASVTEAERAELTRSTARLFEKLLTETCPLQTQQAVKYEGPAALQTSFQLLGQVAARELFSDPSVANGMAELGKQLDNKKLEKVLGAEQ